MGQVVLKYVVLRVFFAAFLFVLRVFLILGVPTPVLLNFPSLSLRGRLSYKVYILTRT